ncbi:MAG TPA: hypothetical protein VL283_04330 [Candidatus Baltobacteraceae bacterium]|nr:hypothetical protein [Candidatus Baltobacteraceae bacterium]
MDLIKLDLEKLDFRRKLDEAEGQAITTRTRKRSGALRSTSALVAGLGGMVLTMLPLMALTFLAMHVSVFLGILSALAMFLSALFAGMYGFMRYLEPADRLLLPTVLEPQARAFFLATADRRERLLEEAEAFDLALGVFKGLPERAGDEVNEGIAVNFSERRARLVAKQEAYLSELAAATVGDRARVAAIEAARKKPRNPRRRELREFADKVRQLAWIERSLDGLDSSVEAGMTVDLSPYVAARRLRDELEEKRAALVARGLKPKRLPPPRTASRKLLTTAT